MNAIFSVCDWPGESSFVLCPLILKSCGRLPLLVTLNVTVPRAAVFFDRMKWNSDGLPAVTAIVAARTVLWFASAGSAQASGAHAATRASKPIRYRIILENP